MTRARVRQSIGFALALVVAAAAAVQAQRRVTSPDGHAATEIRGRYVGPQPTYMGGQWIEISYGRPIKRGRDLWGAGADYGKRLKAGAPVWRAGADTSTYLMTELPLVIGGKTVPPGGYTMFIDLAPERWTLIISEWQPQSHFNPNDRTRLWGAFGYTPDKDVVRVPMKLTTLPFSVDQLTWAFHDMSDSGGAMVLTWDTMMASAPFAIGQ